LQEALAKCGWKEANNGEQQDVSEAFNIITDTLEVPLLSLRMDLYHSGTEVPNDDHKIIHERLLEVAIPDESTVNGRPVRLEDCLETYFNNQVEIFRRTGHSGLVRSNTISSIRSAQSHNEKASSQHVEVAELAGSTSAPATPISVHAPASEFLGRHRAPSLIRHRVMSSDGDEEKEDERPMSRASSHASIRKGSVVRKEVQMPAWQFFNLLRPLPMCFHIKPSNSCPLRAPLLIDNIAWYTHRQPKNDVEVADHFSETRPVLGVCLKRYSMTPEGRATRKNTFVDIPLELRLPHFVDEDIILEDGVSPPLIGDFKLSLQSVICHRGNSVNSGHYLCFVRGETEPSDGDADSSRGTSDSNPPEYAEDSWLKFDDLANERVGVVDIEKSLRDEMPYLLFYQVQPTYQVCAPPSYTADSAVELQLPRSSPTRYGHEDGTNVGHTPVIRFSSEVDRPRRSINLPDGSLDERRGSVAYTEASTASAVSVEVAETKSALDSEIPIANEEEVVAQRPSRAFFSKSGSKSRPSSSSGENRLSGAFSRLSLVAMRSREFMRPDSSRDSMFHTDGAGDTRESLVVSVEDVIASDTGTPIPETPDIQVQKKSKRGRKRNKSKAPLESTENGNAEYGHDQHYHHLGKPLPDRECIIM